MTCFKKECNCDGSCEKPSLTKAQIEQPAQDDAKETFDQPVAWMVYTLDGKSAFVTDNPFDFTTEQKALPLFTRPKKLKLSTHEHAIYCRGFEDGKNALEQPAQDEPVVSQEVSTKRVVSQNSPKVSDKQDEPVAWFEWLPEGTTHIGRISVDAEAGGHLRMGAHAFKYENEVLKVYVTDNDNEYPGWRDAKAVFFHLNFPVIPLYTRPQAREWVVLTDEEIDDTYEAIKEQGWAINYARAIEAKLKEKNT